MKKALKKEETHLFHFIAGEKIIGPNINMRGDSSKLRGDCTGIYGNCTGISGDLDACDITFEEPAGMVSIHSLIAPLTTEEPKND